jgi:glycosyltransferase involved in cell wall biosynthesis
MKIALITPWFGRNLKGGAEQQAWQLAARLAQRNHEVEVITTCCRSHQDDWETNHLPAGRTTEPEGFAVHRFPVEPRDRQRFQQVCNRLLSLPLDALQPGVSPVTNEEADVFVDELIRSPALNDFVVRHKESFAAFIALPYLYGPVIHAIAAAPERICLQACLHDEAYAYLPNVAKAFLSARAIFFISQGEAELAARLYGPAIRAKGFIVGAGVEVPRQATIDRQSSATSPDRFVLYLGRKEPGKNTDLLVRAFTRFRGVRPNSQLRLVLAGYGGIDSTGTSPWIDDRGLVGEDEKQKLLRDCIALAQPSKNESFSRVLMEAWRHGKPVVVNSACLATASEVARSEGGWLAGSEDEWAAWFAEVDCMGPERLAQLGHNGLKHTELVADWDNVILRYEKALRAVNAPVASSPQFSDSTPTINQFLPNLSPGDAISNQAIFIRDQLRELGVQSDIYVRVIHPRLAPNQCHQFSPAALEQSDAVIYHHSIGTDITPHVIGYSGPKCLIYHNITPAEFVQPYRPAFAELLRQGRLHLRDLAPEFDYSYGASHYNAEELAAAGFANPEVLPICVDPRKWSFSPDPELMRTLSDDRTNIIFVGRITPNKKQEELVRVFHHYLALDPRARLFLVGTVEHGDPYADYLFAEIDRLGLRDSVFVTDNIAETHLAAYYRTADLFWTMSEHEGFCVPLIEAMWFDVPVLAFHGSAIPETLGGAALTFTDKSDPIALAALAFLLVKEANLRSQVVAAQRRQRERFLPEKIMPILLNLVSKLSTPHQ